MGERVEIDFMDLEAGDRFILHDECDHPEDGTVINQALCDAYKNPYTGVPTIECSQLSSDAGFVQDMWKLKDSGK